MTEPFADCVDLTVHCLLCEATTTVSISAPGWADLPEDIEGKSLCPEHAAVYAFQESQCPGCVASWGTDCPLFRSFAYSYRRDITRDDLASVRRGICPRRVNGTFSVGPGRFDPIDLSDRAPTEAGEALATAIEDYCMAYPEMAS